MRCFCSLICHHSSFFFGCSCSGAALSGWVGLSKISSKLFMEYYLSFGLDFFFGLGWVCWEVFFAAFFPGAACSSRPGSSASCFRAISRSSSRTDFFGVSEVPFADVALLPEVGADGGDFSAAFLEKARFSPPLDSPAAASLFGRAFPEVRPAAYRPRSFRERPVRAEPVRRRVIPWFFQSRS